MALFDRLLGRPRVLRGAALYQAVVARARREHWYLDGGVADTVDGRFDMVAAVLSMVLLQLERMPGSEELNAALAERFVEDMDGQLRQLGIGDIVVGKHIGRMMAMLGGRLGAYRDGLNGGDLDGALVRNLYRDQQPAPDALAHVAGELRALYAKLGETPMAVLEAGTLP